MAVPVAPSISDNDRPSPSDNQPKGKLPRTSTRNLLAASPRLGTEGGGRNPAPLGVSCPPAGHMETRRWQVGALDLPFLTVTGRCEIGGKRSAQALGDARR
jgi:hypothetical protein